MTEVFGVDVFFVLGVTDIDDKIIARAAEREEEPRAGPPLRTKSSLRI